MKVSLATLFSLLIGLCSFAQVKYTKLSGKLTDSASGTPVVGASVIVENSSLGTKTDVEGNFFLQVQVNKTYSLRISSVGFQTKVVSDIQVNDNNTPVLNITMEKGAEQMNTIVIRANARRESVASLYTIQKNSSAISDAISAEVIKRSPDRTTSEVLRRVSGTSIQDNKFVIIRGLSERYNTSLLNNAILPSTEPDKKAFSFDIIPSSLIDNVTIFKSPTPDLPGDFAGGAIKITTKDYPSKSLSEVSFSMGYNNQTTFKNFYKGFPEGKLDWLGFFDNSRLIPRPYYLNRGSKFITLSDNQKMAISQQFPNTFGYAPAYQSQPNFSFSYTGGNTKLMGNNKLGYIYGISYSNGRRVVERTRDEWQLYDFQEYQYNTTNYDMRSTLSALLNFTYSYGKSKISLKNLYNNDFVKTVGLRTGSNFVNAGNTFNYKGSNTEAAANGIESSVLEGLHSLNKGWTVDWNASFSTTYRWQPDQKIITFVSDPNTQDYYIRLNNQNSPEITNSGRVYSFLNEYIYGATGNAVKQFNWHNQVQKLKVGTMNYYRDRLVEVDAVGFSTLSPYGGRIQETKNTTFSNVFSPENLETYGVVYANIGSNSIDYTGTGLLNSGYAMLDNKFSDKVKLSWGARVEKYRQQLVIVGQPDVILDNTDVLPSFLFTYALNSKTNLRAAASQSVNRPEFRELAGNRAYDYENNFIVQGNKQLVRSKNTNADLRYEWFPGSGEIISASAFYKYFANPIEQTNEGNDILSWANAENASVYGLELEVRKRLNFFNNEFFDRLVFYANAAYMKGSVKFKDFTTNNPMQGQSPYLLNGGMSYSNEKDDLSFNLLYNRIGPRLKFRAQGGAGRNIFEKPRDVMDFQVSKKFINNRLEVKLTVSDIFAQAYTWYYKYDANPSKISFDPSTDRIVNSYKYGTTTSVGLRYLLSK